MFFGRTSKAAPRLARRPFQPLTLPRWLPVAVLLAAPCRPTTPHIWLPSTWSELISEIFAIPFTGYWKPSSSLLFRPLPFHCGALTSWLSIGIHRPCLFIDSRIGLKTTKYISTVNILRTRGLRRLTRTCSNFPDWRWRFRDALLHRSNRKSQTLP